MRRWEDKEGESAEGTGWMGERGRRRGEGRGEGGRVNKQMSTSRSSYLSRGGRGSRQGKGKGGDEAGNHPGWQRKGAETRAYTEE
eukprot:1215963-Rhodomonas_salina.2